MGTVALAIAATPESTCFSPHAIRTNGNAAFRNPMAKAFQPVPRPRPPPHRRPGAPEEHRREHRRRQDEAEEHHRRGLDLVDRDLDEEVRSPPDRGDDREQRNIAADHPEAT